MPKLKAVIDEDLPRLVGAALKDIGWEVMDVRDIGLRGYSDPAIISFAKKSKAVLFTGDWGFANILNYPPKNYFGIVLLAFPNEMSPKTIAAEIKKSLALLQPKSFRSRLIILEPGGKIRMRLK